MCTEEHRELEQAGVTILYCYGVCIPELAKEWHCENNRYNLCKHQLALLTAALGNAKLLPFCSEFDSSLKW